MPPITMGDYMKKMLFAVICLFAVSGVFAQQATIQDLAGTVEFKRPGSSVWETAKKGQSITSDTTISTGFRSTAIIAAGSSVITVRPLTRLTLAELVASAGTETINVNLQAGRVKVDVTPPAGTRTNMNVQGPTATASVRGTAFEFDVYNITVIKGTVEFTGSSGPVVLIDAGRRTFTDETLGWAVPLANIGAEDLEPEMPVGFGPVMPANTEVGLASGEPLDLSVVIDF